MLLSQNNYSFCIDITFEATIELCLVHYDITALHKRLDETTWLQIWIPKSFSKKQMLISHAAPEIKLLAKAKDEQSRNNRALCRLYKIAVGICNCNWELDA